MWTPRRVVWRSCVLANTIICDTQVGVFDGSFNNGQIIIHITFSSLLNVHRNGSFLTFCNMRWWMFVSPDNYDALFIQIMAISRRTMCNKIPQFMHSNSLFAVESFTFFNVQILAIRECLGGAGISRNSNISKCQFDFDWKSTRNPSAVSFYLSNGHQWTEICHFKIISLSRRHKSMFDDKQSPVNGQQ